MYEQAFYSHRINALEIERATRIAERDRVLRERLGLADRRAGLIERIRLAAARRRAASEGAESGRTVSGRDLKPCVNCPASA